MPSLTRRRSDNPHQVTWHVYYGDVHVGTIGERAGVRSTSINRGQRKAAEWTRRLSDGTHDSADNAT
jgi:hypothetical protein